MGRRRLAGHVADAAADDAHRAGGAADRAVVGEGGRCARAGHLLRRTGRRVDDEGAPGPAGGAGHGERVPVGCRAVRTAGGLRMTATRLPRGTLDADTIADAALDAVAEVGVDALTV